MFKMINAGDGGVGKTTFLKRYTTGEFVENSKETIGTGFFTKKYFRGRRREQLDLTFWDLGGQDRFRHIVKDFVLGAAGALLFYDITRYATFEGLYEWLDILRSDQNEMNMDIPIILVGSKNDLDDLRAVDPDDALEFVNRNDLLGYIETSSKTGENVEKAIEVLVERIFKTNKGIY